MNLFPKASSIISIIIYSLLFLSCEKSKSGSNTNTVTVQQWQEEQLKQQQIKQEQLRQERIKSQRVALATEYANRFTTKTVEAISPSTGKDKKTLIKNINYDANTQRVTLKIKSSWYANPTNWNPLADHKLHSMTGNLTLYGDNKTEYNLIEQNDVMDTAKLNQAVYEIIVALSEDNE